MELHSLFADFDPAHDIGAQEAVRSLLGSEVTYSGDLSQHVTLAPYDRSKLALPGIRTPANSLVDLLDSEASKTIVGFKTELLLDEHSYNSRIHEEGKAVPYLDPRLRNTKEYQLFISELYSQHIIGFIDVCQSMCGAFTVVKKDGQLRLIIDARPTNQMFKKCASMPMGGSSAWSSISVPDSSDLYNAQYDVEAYFYRCGLPSDWWPYFCLPRVRRDFAEALGYDTSGLRGEYIYPCLRVLPMGFSWAMFFAQRVHVHTCIRVCQRIASLSTVDLLLSSIQRTRLLLCALCLIVTTGT